MFSGGAPKKEICDDVKSSYNRRDRFNCASCWICPSLSAHHALQLCNWTVEMVIGTISFATSLHFCTCKDLWSSRLIIMNSRSLLSGVTTAADWCLKQMNGKLPVKPFCWVLTEGNCRAKSKSLAECNIFKKKAQTNPPNCNSKQIRCYDLFV